MPAPWAPQTVTAKAVVAAGFLYDPSQDIIYSHMNALQRQAGYTWAYDVAAPSGSMIIDCEPIYFTARKTRWMIELWKGQYGIETGAEIGLYNDPRAVAPTGSERGLLYECADNTEMSLLRLSFRLNRNGKEIFRRGPESHWWLTGFKWGVFTDQTSRLTMDITIEFLRGSADMQSAFLRRLDEMSYRPAVSGTTVRFQFNKPWTLQPGTRMALEKPVQLNNEFWVNRYNELKTELGLSSNDPNGFLIPALEKPQRVPRSQLPPPLRNAVKPVRQAVKPARQAVKKVVAQAAGVVKDDVGDQVGLHEVFAFFHNKVWHNTRQPGQAS